MSWIVDERAPWILVTNDDSADSPALEPLLCRLATIAPVRAVVPAAECSWTAKRMTRFGELDLEEIECGGFPTWTLSGSPADCANLGINNLCSRRPSLVVSGINIGTNAGLAYMLSSGTVGAAVEAALCGVPSAAFSVELEKPDYKRWRTERNLDSIADLWISTAAVSAEIVAEILAAGLPENASLLNVNMPPGTTVLTPRRFTGISQTTYGRFFKRLESGRYAYDSAELEILKPDSGADVEVLRGGEVSITPIRFGLEVEAPVDRHRFERG